MDIGDNTFEEEVKNFKGLVVVDFWAEWCVPCRIQTPVLEEVANELKADSEFKFVKVNTDENPNLTQEYGIMSIPTMMFFVNGDLKDTKIGVTPKEEILNLIKSLKSAK